MILLGDVIEQRMHYIRSKNHKVLCGASVGACSLCLKAAESDDISVSHSEYLAPAYVRLRKGREYAQRVAVFTAVAGELVRDVAKGPARSLRFEVYRASKQKIEIKPRGQCRCYLPPAFDLLPFVRARFGLPQEPSRPLVMLPPFNMSEADASPTNRPAALDLTAADCVPNPDEMARIKAIMAARMGGDPPATAAVPAPTPPRSPNGFVTTTPPTTDDEYSDLTPKRGTSLTAQILGNTFGAAPSAKSAKGGAA